MDLKSAYREIGFRCKHFMIMKKSNEPKDLFCLHRAFEKKGGQEWAISLKDQIHINQVIANKNLTKLYFSEEIAKPYRYLGLMVLGLEYLRMTANFEDEKEGREIFHEKLQESIQDCLEP